MKKNKNLILIFIAILLSIILAILIFYLLKPTTNNKGPNENKILYSEKAIEAMNELKVYSDITNLDYSKTIEILLEETAFKKEFLDTYYNIAYQPIENFSNTINTFIEKNYNPEEINHILSNYSNNLEILLNMEYLNILQFKDITNFDITKIDRYLDYQKNNDYDIKTVVTYVNIGLDKAGYSEYTSHTLEKANTDLTILVNKYNKLPDDFEPHDLVSLSYNKTYQLRKEAAEAFEKLTSAALIDNVRFYPFSAYRSYKTQNVLYTRYKAKDGEKLADTYSARPGFSEHQTGLAVDVRSNTLSDNLTANDYEWMLNNSYKYGFIVRYPKGKQHITQFIEEPWHLRYLGTPLATKVTESGLTFDEYYDLYLKK